MSERLRESLSALMDDEADDLELGRILRAMEDDSGLRATWSRYQLVSAVLQGKAPVPGLRPLALDVMAEEDAHLLDADHALDDSARPGPHEADSRTAAATTVPRSLPWRAFTSFAVAASVTAVAVVGWQWQVDGAPDGAAAIAESPAASAPSRNLERSFIQATGQPTGQQRVEQRGRGMDALLSAERSTEGAAVVRPSSTESARLVEAYMLQHAEHNALHSRSGMMPFARMAAFDGAQ